MIAKTGVHTLVNGIDLKFGGHQKSASIHNQAAARFGELLRERLGERANARWYARQPADVQATFVKAMEPVLANYRKSLDARLFSLLAGEGA